jgi:asparaginyl-tRNA synthetase
MNYYLKKNILKDDQEIKSCRSDFKMPAYSPENHYLDLTDYPYFRALLYLRHHIKVASDYYFASIVGAKNIDLFMFTPSISSPIGSGSDSEPIKIKFGKFDTNLVDSSQFGFEPLLLNGINKVYCYLPSMRGEDPDPRHLNQYFHCEMEMIGGLDELIPIIEDYIKTLCKTILLMPNIVDKISVNPSLTKKFLKKISHLDKFPQITFDEAIQTLIDNGRRDHINFTKKGRDISSKGEIELMKISKIKTPLWIKYYDRDRVAFYQKPHPKDKNKTINADLIFPPIIDGGFGGEIVGSGQRQNKPREMYESLERQNDIPPKPYEWYINLRKLKNYQTSSGFGLGIERFIAWSLGKDNIRDVIIYPRLKNVKTYP